MGISRRRFSPPLLDPLPLIRCQLELELEEEEVEGGAVFLEKVPCPKASNSKMCQPIILRLSTLLILNETE